MDRSPRLDHQRAGAHGRTLDHPCAGGAGAGTLDRDLRPAGMAQAAPSGGVFHDLGGALHRHRRRAQDADERRLPVGSQLVRRPLPVRGAVRRPPGCAARRALLPGSTRQLRLRAARPILHVSRAARRAGEAGARAGAADRTGVRHRAAGARRSLRFARPVERVHRVDRHAVGLRVRVPWPVMGIRPLRCIE